LLSTVSLNRNYLTANGKSFIPIGVNWVPAKSGMQWPFEWDIDLIESDFANISKLGFNLIRFDLLWGWYEPNPGQYNEVAFSQFDHLISLAHEYNIYLNPALLIGGEVGDAYWDIHWRNGRHPHNDPELLYWQGRHVEEFARRYNTETAILAWDLTDEPPFWIVASSTTDAMAINWTKLLCSGIRKYDQKHLILCGTLGQETNRGPFRADNLAPFVDVFCVHPYPAYDPILYHEPLLSTRTTYGASFEITLSRGAGHPVIMQEFGAGNSQFSPQVVGQYYKTLLYSALASGVQGYAAWCYTDASPSIFNRAPYIRCPHETQFGITDYLGNPKPAGTELGQFAKILQQIDLEQVEPALPEAGLIIPNEWAKGHDYSQYNLSSTQPTPYVTNDILSGEKDLFGNQFTVKSWLASFILSRQAGIMISFPRELDDWTKLPLILAPVPSTISPNPTCHLYTTFWKKVTPLVEAGATLYASLCSKSAISIPEINILFGAQIADHCLWKALVKLTMIEDFYHLKKGDIIEFICPQGLEGMGVELEISDGHVLAIDQDGKPALLMKSVGLGHTLLCAYPLEYALGDTVNAFENLGNVQLLYKSLKSLAQIHSPFTVDNFSIELSWLSGNERDYVIIVNHSKKSTCSTINSRTPGRAGYVLPDGIEWLNNTSQSFDIELPGYSGRIYVWEHGAISSQYD
jgi:endo-1,4-beta-mannosidase